MPFRQANDLRVCTKVILFEFKICINNMATNIESLRNYKNCLLYCSYASEESQQALEECIEDIKSDHSDPNLCREEQEVECPVIETAEFRSLMEFLLQFLRILYGIRTYYQNKNDENVITSLGLLDLSSFGLNVENLKCVNLQDYTPPGMPSNLGDYLDVMREIRRLISEGKNYLTDGAENGTLRDYGAFLSDYQPWSRLLSTCVDKYVRMLNIFPSGIPDIANVRNYGSFASSLSKSELEEILKSFLSDPNYIIRYIQSKKAGGRIKRSIKRSNRRQTRLPKKMTKKTKRRNMRVLRKTRILRKKRNSK